MLRISGFRQSPQPHVNDIGRLEDVLAGGAFLDSMTCGRPAWEEAKLNIAKLVAVCGVATMSKGENRGIEEGILRFAQCAGSEMVKLYNRPCMSSRQGVLMAMGGTCEMDAPGVRGSGTPG